VVGYQLDDEPILYIGNGWISVYQDVESTEKIIIFDLYLILFEQARFFVNIFFSGFQATRPWF